MHSTLQDHNTDYIVKFPDWDPSGNTPRISVSPNLVGVRRRKMLSVHETLPHPHMWYDNRDAIHALKLFLDAGSELAEIPTYR